jgi:hypothetical protein
MVARIWILISVESSSRQGRSRDITRSATLETSLIPVGEAA